MLAMLQGIDPVIEHFGSTSVPGLAAKPIIDILVGVKDKIYFSSIVERLLEHSSYIYYQAFNKEMPDRRLFVRLKDGVDTGAFESVMDDLDTIPHDQINLARIAHIHIWEIDSEDWIRHIAFREYLKAHDDVREEYAALKRGLGKKNWSHGMEYNDGKNAFIKEEEAKAIAWYKHTQL